MANANDSGDKNEKPTPKKLKDARKEGNVAKSRDLSQTLMTLAWILIISAFAGLYADRMGALFERSWSHVGSVSQVVIADISLFAFETVLWLVVAPLAFASLIGILIEFLQVGPLLTFKKLAPKASHIHPVEGFKRMFSKNNVFEAAKSLVKTALLTLLVVMVTLQYLNDMLRLPFHDISRFVELEHHVLKQLGLWVVAAFGFISLVDVLYQKHSRLKKLQMSLHDIRQEHKQSEGDPQLKGKRKQLHREWSMQDILQASRNASAMLVNPTHIAIAISYQPEELALPVVAAKGEGADALRMREAALESGVPVLRHVPLARELNFRSDFEDVVPEDLFDAIAEVLAWADRLKRDYRDDNAIELYHEYEPANVVATQSQQATY